MGIGKLSRVELHLKHGLAVLVAVSMANIFSNPYAGHRTQKLSGGAL